MRAPDEGGREPPHSRTGRERHVAVAVARGRGCTTTGYPVRLRPNVAPAARGRCRHEPGDAGPRAEAAGVCPSDLYRDLGLSGTTASTSRAGWRALQVRLRPGDTVVVVELARIGRRWTEAVNTIRQLRADGVRFRSLAESESTWSRYLEADEDSPDHFVGTIMLLFGAWAAQQELEAVRRRTLAGLARARAEGKHLGRPKLRHAQLRDLAAQLRLDGRSYGEIAKTLGVPRSTVQGWLRVP